MPFEPRGLSKGLKEKLNAFLQSHIFPNLYKAYTWKNDAHVNGFAEIYRLESQLVRMDQTSGISLEDVKCVADWGGLRNIGRIEGEDVVLKPHSLNTFEALTVPALGDAPLTPLLRLRQNIAKGVGPTYFSKIMRFGLPQEYGAIDSRLIRVFGQGDSATRNWLELSARNYGSGWHIPEIQAGWPTEYGTWINILRYFACALPDNCPHPEWFVAAGLRKSGVWGCADVEMALFSYASQILHNIKTKRCKN
jgi:hypothetical protein